MSNPKKINQNLTANIEVQSLKNLEEKSGNLYKSIYVVSKRSNQIHAHIREELHSKLDEFANHQDNLEEIFENREQIEISKHYEKMPKATLVALDEFMDDKIYHRSNDSSNAIE